MKLSEMKQILAEREIQLTKSLGQNFLHDRNQLLRIADAAELRKADKVLEIGPGLGPLTELLIERAGEVLAIEKDCRLVEILVRRFGSAQSTFSAASLCGQSLLPQPGPLHKPHPSPYPLPVKGERTSSFAAPP